MKATEIAQWQATEFPPPTGEDVYELLQKHRLAQQSTELTIAICKEAASGRYFQVVSPEDGLIAHVFVTGMFRGEQANITVVPITKHFRSGFDEPFHSAMAPVLRDLFDVHGVRRLNAESPKSRSRTKRALCSLGFVSEGKAADGVQMLGEKPEDLKLLGLTARNYAKTRRE